MNRPEYVCCVKFDQFKSWCGRNVGFEWAFQDATHALLNSRNEGRLLICPECSSQLIETAKSGTWHIP